MYFAHFECINRVDNALRFFRYEITPGFFGVTYLKAVAGRIGTEGTLRDLASGSETALIDPLVEDARKRVRHGYVLVRADLPPLIAAALDEVVADVDARTVTDGDIARARTLKAARALLREHTSDPEAARSVDRLLSRVEPDKRRAAKHTRNKRRSTVPADTAMDAPRSRIDGQRAQGQVLRGVVALVARELLRDDPLAMDSVLTGLSLPFPDEIDGSNVTFLRMTGDRILTMSIEQFVQDARLDGEPRLDPIVSEALRAASIDTVGDLVRCDHDTLHARTGLDQEEVQALVRGCARYKLHFNMEQVRYVRAPVRA